MPRPGTYLVLACACASLSVGLPASSVAQRATTPASPANSGIQLAQSTGPADGHEQQASGSIEETLSKRYKIPLINGHLRFDYQGQRPWSYYAHAPNHKAWWCLLSNNRLIDGAQFSRQDWTEYFTSCKDDELNRHMITELKRLVDRLTYPKKKADRLPYLLGVVGQNVMNEFEYQEFVELMRKYIASQRLGPPVRSVRIAVVQQIILRPYNFSAGVLPFEPYGNTGPREGVDVKRRTLLKTLPIPSKEAAAVVKNAQGSLWPRPTDSSTCQPAPRWQRPGTGAPSTE